MYIDLPRFDFPVVLSEQVSPTLWTLSPKCFLIQYDLRTRRPSYPRNRSLRNNRKVLLNYRYYLLTH